ncbi:uncharacterized protein B0H64DRAFT_471232 [Chaetomium fimeti]|uniref:C2H2-type domain-containing protein n=1 Tax=Chaetomium fimeti TaxID=1854472 RepID=A0AAE0HRB4_9PEZI|nr:hypothetical protein B0H64DRAFT_471232 [Chaetomium fimeti]
MVNPYVLGGASFPDEDLPFMSQPYNEYEDGFGASNRITFIDPDLQTPSPTSYGNLWAAPVPQSHKENHSTYLGSDLSRRVSSHAPLRPAIALPPTSSSYPRCPSPLSSIEPSPPGGGLSPGPDTESYHDGYPRTPPDTNLLSPFQGFLPLEPTAHAVQFMSMGPDYVNPFEVNSTQQLEYSESDNGIADFDFTTPVQPNYFDSHVGHDLEPPQGTAATLDFSVSQAALEPMQSIAKGEIEAPSEYPPLEEDASSEGEPLGKRRNDDDDEDYQPIKKQRTSARTSARRADKIAIAAPVSPSSRRTRNRAANPTAAPRVTHLSSGNNRARLSCPDCKKTTFTSQSDLEAHLNKEHRRPFNCVFDFAGCNSTFANKNEWKRHVSTQHLLLHYWVCTEGACAHAHANNNNQTGAHALSPIIPTTPDSTTTTTTQPTGAIFNRKDLFTQHLKRMHAPKEVKDLPAKRTTTTSSSNTTKQPTSATANALAQWNTRLKHLQDTAIRPRCQLPQLMRCPVAGCGAGPFRGDGAWNERMEHVAKHMDRAARGGNGNGTSTTTTTSGGEAGGRVVFGGEGDASLVEWAASSQVAIIIPRGDGKGWVLKAPLRRGPGGNVVVTAPVVGGGGEEGRVEGEIVVADGGEEEDAEGEEDD